MHSGSGKQVKYKKRRLLVHLGPLIVARVISVQQVTGSISSVVPRRAAASSEDEAPQHGQAVVAPLGWQLRLQLPASRLAIEPTNGAAQLLAALKHLDVQTEGDTVSFKSKVFI